MVELGTSALGVSETCRLLGIPRSSYYAQRLSKPKRKMRCRALTAHIFAVFDEHRGRYRSPRVCRIAEGSVAEVKACLDTAEALGYLPLEDAAASLALIDRVQASRRGHLGPGDVC